MNKSIFRASWTVLDAWSRGDWNRAVEMYFKLKDFITPSMVIGKKYHEEWKTETNKTKKLPKVFGSKKLKQPKTELKKVVTLEEWLNLVGIIDCIDTPTIYEYKTGNKSSEQYASSKQTGVYGVLAICSGIYTDRIEIYRWNQHKKQYDMSFVWLTDKLIQDSHNWILTNAGEMHNYLIENKLYEQFALKRGE